jgi:hypothetical protein
MTALPSTPPNEEPVWEIQPDASASGDPTSALAALLISLALAELDHADTDH